jgi:hypothetical protein
LVTRSSPSTISSPYASVSCGRYVQTHLRLPVLASHTARARMRRLPRLPLHPYTTSAPQPRGWDVIRQSDHTSHASALRLVCVVSRTQPGGPVGMDTSITVMGTGFAEYGTDQLQCRVGGVGGVLARGELLDGGRILCTMSAPTFVGGVSVTVSLNNGTSGTFSQDAPNFIQYAPPLLTSIDPTGGDAEGGTVVTIMGAGFLAMSSHMSDAKCVFGDVGTSKSVSATLLADNQASCVTPWGVEGGQPVQLSLNGQSYIQRRALTPEIGWDTIDANLSTAPGFYFVGTRRPQSLDHMERAELQSARLCTLATTPESQRSTRAEGCAAVDGWWHGAGLHPPALIEAYFPPLGTTLVIRFDAQATNRAGMNGVALYSLTAHIPITPHPPQTSSAQTTPRRRRCSHAARHTCHNERRCSHAARHTCHEPRVRALGARVQLLDRTRRRDGVSDPGQRPRRDPRVLLARRLYACRTALPVHARDGRDAHHHTPQRPLAEYVGDLA